MRITDAPLIQNVLMVRAADALVVGNDASLHGDIEVDAHEHVCPSGQHRELFSCA